MSRPTVKTRRGGKIIYFMFFGRLKKRVIRSLMAGLDLDIFTSHLINVNLIVNNFSGVTVHNELTSGMTQGDVQCF